MTTFRTRGKEGSLCRQKISFRSIVGFGIRPGKKNCLDTDR